MAGLDFPGVPVFPGDGQEPSPALAEMRAVALEHLEGIYSLYGDELGVRIARKHIGWYTRGLPGGELSAARRSRFCLRQSSSRRSALLRWFGRMSRNTELAEAVKRSLERYFRDMDGEQPTAIYDMVLKNIERPLIETVLGKAEGNQSAAAAMLGIDRNTLRKKIQQLRIKA
jgi:Fis family transcriptional regulator